MLRKTCHFYGTISLHMVIPHFVTDRSDSVVLCCFEHPVKQGKTCCVPNTHVQTNETCFPVICSSHIFPWTMSVRRYIPFPLACWGISELFCHTVSQFFCSLTQLAVMRKDLLTPNSVRVCYPEKRHTPPSREEKGVLNYICLLLRMCCGCNVTQANNGSENIKTKKYREGDDVWVTCISCNSVKNEATIYKDNRFVLFEKAIWEAWPDLQK